ncbi:MAG TPA: response regulator [Candidatus Acidoferrum sp.]|nr:response regulator [Candidatus Acidoferrum sp.]
MKQVLVLDDDVAVLRYFLLLLTQGQRCEVTALCDSRKALEAIESRDFAAVILDMDMPGVHGREVLQRIRQRQPGAAVIIVTGVEDEQLAAESLHLGAFAYLYKPVSEGELLCTLGRALETCADEEADQAVPTGSPTCSPDSLPPA